MIYWRTMEEGLKKTEQTAFARTLLLDALRKEYGITRLPEIARTPYGKPYFLNYPELYFNYSHSKHAAACVLSKQAVGIDLEQIRNYSEKTAQRFCSQGEWVWLQRQPDLNKAWIQIWTNERSMVKIPWNRAACGSSRPGFYSGTGKCICTEGDHCVGTWTDSYCLYLFLFHRRFLDVCVW